MENTARKKEDEIPRQSREITKGEVYREGQGCEEECKGRSKEMDGEHPK